MKSARFILSFIAGGLSVMHFIWPHQSLIPVAVLLLAIAVVISEKAP